MGLSRRKFTREFKLAGLERSGRTNSSKRDEAGPDCKCGPNHAARRLSPLERDSQPELYPSSGESRCFLFSSFN
jgi:hypothetical protein